MCCASNVKLCFLNHYQYYFKNTINSKVFKLYKTFLKHIFQPSKTYIFKNILRKDIKNKLFDTDRKKTCKPSHKIYVFILND